MARLSRPVTLLFAAGLSLAALPAVAQFGSIFRDETPRPPGNIPDRPSAPNNFPPFPRPPSFPSERESRPLPPPQQPQQQPQRRLPVPTNLPQPPSAPPADGGRGGAIQSQPLPPPLGGTAAPPQEASPGQPGGPEPGQAGAPETATASQGLPPREVVVEPPPQRITNPTAVFAGLDKITGRITSFEVAIDETVQFGALRVTPRACYSRPPTESPRTDAFLDVDEVTLQGEVRRIFTGWMFASSPGLHAVEHPIYDIWLKDCKGGKLEVAGSESDQPQRQAQPAPRATRRR